MLSDIEQLLDQAAGPLPQQAPETAILRRAGLRRRRRRVGQVALSLVLLVAVPVVAVNVLSRPNVQFAPADQPADGPDAGDNRWCAAGAGDAPGGGDGQCDKVIDRINNLKFVVPDGWLSSFGAQEHGGRELHAFTTAPADVFAQGSRCLVPVMSEMGEEGAAVAVLSASKAEGLAFPPRPKIFTFNQGEAAPPFGTPCGAPADATIAWFSFRDAGRKFHAVVAVGPQASTARRNAALRVLNSMEVLRPDTDVCVEKEAMKVGMSSEEAVEFCADFNNDE